MFDTISGLPVHALVVHAVVVLLPLMAVLSVLVAAVPKWRKYLSWVVLGNASVLVAAFVAKQSGEALRARLGGEIAKNHAQWGNLVPFFAFFLLVASVIAWWATRRGGVRVPNSIGLVGVAAVAAVAMTVVTGDTGARAVWETTIAHTSPPAGDR